MAKVNHATDRRKTGPTAEENSKKKVETENVEIMKIGVGLDTDEIELLKLPPKFCVRKEFDEEEFDLEFKKK